MKTNTFFATALGLSLGIALIGCSQESENAQTSEEQIQAVVESDETFYIEGGNDEGMQDAEYNNFDSSTSIEDSNEVKMRFGRKMTNLEKYFSFEIDGTTATSVVTHIFDGTFKVGTKEDGLLYEKPYQHKVQRNVDFTASTNTAGDEIWEWENTYVGVGYSSDAEVPNNTFDFTKVTIDAPSFAEAIEITDPNTFVVKRDELIEVVKDEEISIFVETNNLNEELVGLLHYGVNKRHKHRARTKFNDEGIAPDLVAGDGIYSGTWTVKQRYGKHLLIIDFIDKDTIEDENAAYNSVTWNFPYKVVGQ